MSSMTNNERRRGTTLIELLAAALIMTAVLGGIGVTVMSGTRSYEQGVVKAEVDGQARRLAALVAAEFLKASEASCAEGPFPPWSGALEDDGDTEYSFRHVVRVVAGNPIMGPLRRIRLDYAAGEVDDGIDNNANGLVDECRILLTQNVVNGPEVGVGGFVREFLEGEEPNDIDDNGNGLSDERGLCMTFDETTRTMMVRVTVERLTSQGRLITSTAETAVHLRND